jgi:hypothetical protein
MGKEGKNEKEGKEREGDWHKKNIKKIKKTHL